MLDAQAEQIGGSELVIIATRLDQREHSVHQRVLLGWLKLQRQLPFLWPLCTLGALAKSRLLPRAGAARRTRLLVFATEGAETGQGVGRERLGAQGVSV